MNIGQQIAKYRKEKRLTQEQLGEAVGVTGRSVSKWEVGLSSPGVDLIPSIAAALGITLDELFGIQPKEKQKNLSEIVREAVAEALEQKLPDLLEENLDELMPAYLNKQKGDEYTLTVLSRDKKTVCKFTGFGVVRGPATLNDRPNTCWLWLGNNNAAGYDTPEAAAADLKRVFQAYNDREAKIEL